MTSTQVFCAQVLAGAGNTGQGRPGQPEGRDLPTAADLHQHSAVDVAPFACLQIGLVAVDLMTRPIWRQGKKGATGSVILRLLKLAPRASESAGMQ